MAVCPECGTIIENYGCAVCDSTGIGSLGNGEETSFSYFAKFDPDEDNVASCVNGLLAEPPSYILTPPACSITNSAPISTDDDVDKVLTFDTERYDNDSMHSTVTDTDQVFFNTAGLYLVTVDVAWAANATGSRKVSVYKNGIHQVGHAARTSASASFPTGVTCAFVEPFVVGDSIRVRTRQDSGGALNVLSARYSPNLVVKFLRTIPEEFIS